MVGDGDLPSAGEGVELCGIIARTVPAEQGIGSVSANGEGRASPTGPALWHTITLVDLEGWGRRRCMRGGSA